MHMLDAFYIIMPYFICENLREMNLKRIYTEPQRDLGTEGLRDLGIFCQDDLVQRIPECFFYNLRDYFIIKSKIHKIDNFIFLWE